MIKLFGVLNKKQLIITINRYKQFNCEWSYSYLNRIRSKGKNVGVVFRKVLSRFMFI